MSSFTLKQAIQQPRTAVDLLWYRAFRWVGHNHYKRFIVLGRPRTGSSLLISLLNSHPNIHARGEIFLRLNGRDYRQILDSAFCKQPPGVKAAGFKIFYLQPYDDKNSGVWDELIAMSQLYVIHLKRRNYLRTLLSKKISHQTKVSKATEGNRLQDRRKRDVELTYEAYLQNIEKRQVEFTYQELVSEFDTLQRLEETFDNRFGAHPRLTVYYEDLVRNLNRQFENLTNFLELPFYSPKTQYVRLNPEKLSSLINNYESLKEEFSDTKWAHFFEEETSEQTG